MAKSPPKERPYHCKLCNEPLAESELGFVCQHVAHGTMVTFVAAPPTRDKPIPDTPCTACDLALTEESRHAEGNANIHVVCGPCYRKVRARNIDYFTPADRERGYVLVKRAHYDTVAPREKPLAIGQLFEGRELKVGFSPIPSTEPISLERMWVRVTHVKGGVIHAALANDPQLFKRKTLKADDTVVLKAHHVLEIEANPRLREAPAKDSARKAKEEAAAAKKKMAEVEAAKKKAATDKTRAAAERKREAAAKKAAKKKAAAQKTREVAAREREAAAKKRAAATAKRAEAALKKRAAALKKRTADLQKKLADVKRKAAAARKQTAKR